MFPGSHRLQRQPTAHENWKANGKTITQVFAQKLPPGELDALDWQLPKGGVTMELNPGDAVIWHGNSWRCSCARRPNRGDSLFSASNYEVAQWDH